MNHRAKKRFGQNFLIDDSIIEKIVMAIDALNPKQMVEIGPGQGAITQHLINMQVPLHLVEIDRDLVSLLEKKFGSHPNFNLHSHDALKFDFNALAAEGPLTVVGNLPYNISTPLIFHLFESIEHIDNMLFMIQKEVVERMCAAQGTEHYGRLSIMTQYYCHAQMLFLVPPESFTPAPKVMSAIIQLSPKSDRIDIGDEKLFATLVKTAFSYRRKTIRNVWKSHLSADELSALELDPGVRPETLSLEDYAKVSRYLSDK